MPTTTNPISHACLSPKLTSHPAPNSPFIFLDTGYPLPLISLKLRIFLSPSTSNPPGLFHNPHHGTKWCTDNARRWGLQFLLPNPSPLYLRESWARTCTKCSLDCPGKSRVVLSHSGLIRAEGGAETYRVGGSLGAGDGVREPRDSRGQWERVQMPGGVVKKGSWKRSQKSELEEGTWESRQRSPGAGEYVPNPGRRLLKEFRLSFGVQAWCTTLFPVTSRAR